MECKIKWLLHHSLTAFSGDKKNRWEWATIWPLLCMYLQIFQGLFVKKPIDTNPRFKVNWGFHFSHWKCKQKIKVVRSQSQNQRYKNRAANNFSFLKGHMSNQDSILVGQNRNVVGCFFNYYFLSGSLFEIIIFFIIINSYLLFGNKICPDIMSDQSWDFVGHGPILVGHCLMTNK